jgi:hypothetical protein
LNKQHVPILRISEFIRARFKEVFVIKDMTLLDETDSLWHFELLIAGPFEEMTKKIIVKKDAYLIWNCLEEGIKWSE